MKDPIELRPCPFCGGPAESDRNRLHATHERRVTSVAIYCTKCLADMQLCRVDFPDRTTEDLFATLVAEWNKRTPDNSGTVYGWRKGMTQAAEICIENECPTPQEQAMSERIIAASESTDPWTNPKLIG